MNDVRPNYVVTSREQLIALSIDNVMFPNMFNNGASSSTTVRSSLCPLSPTQCTASTIHFGKFPSAISLEPFQLSSCTK